MFKKFFVEKHVDLLLIGEEGKRHYVLIKDFNTFMRDDTLHRGRKHFEHLVQIKYSNILLKIALKCMASK